MFQPIHHTFGPHCTPAYTLQSLKLLFRPWLWTSGPHKALLKERLERMFDGKCSLFFSGRQGLLSLFQSDVFSKGNEIIIQGFTCIALPNAIHAAGLTPIYADIDERSLNLDPESVKKCITPRTKAVVVQHTFGLVAEVEEIRTLCDKHNILLIEDCAHTIPDVTGPKSIGKYADVIMMSFGRDKAVSGVAGGAIISRKDSIASHLRNVEGHAKPVSSFTVLRLLLYPIIHRIALPLYGITIGKLLLWLAGKSGLLIPVLSREERGGYQSMQLQSMPNACCALTLHQLKNLHSLNNHRRSVVETYNRADLDGVVLYVDSDQPLQKYPLLRGDAARIRSSFKAKNMYLNDGWTGSVVCPAHAKCDAAGYTVGTCPVAEGVSTRIVCLPTHPTMTQLQAKKLISSLQQTPE